MDKNLRILNLEDVATDSELVQHVLHKEGFVFEMLRVDGKEEFITALSDFKPDLILSDYALPSFNGLSALKIAREILPEIPFIFISGTLGEERAIETLKTGATDYVLKDRLSRLAPVVRRALQEAAERLIRKQAEDERNKLWAAVETGGDWVLITDPQGTIEYVNQAVEQISGYTKEEILGRNSRMFKPEKQDEALYSQMWEAILSGRSFRSIIINRKKNGEQFYLDLTITPLRDKNDKTVNFVATGKDISEKKLMEERLNYLAYNDMLTGLANRSLFFDRLQQAISITVPGKTMVVAAIIDLQHFKYINETFGVTAGDEVLKEVAGRLTEAVRPGDTVARYAGDSFGLILPEIVEMRDAVLFIEKIITILSSPYRYNHEEMINTFSMGIALSPNDSSDPQTLMKHAETALFNSKERRGNSYRFYTPGMNIIASDFLTMEKNLYHALAANEFVLQYQPYFDLKTDTLKGMEALIRWRRKDGSYILPGEFIPILEETGQIVAVGDWVIKTACEQIKKWRSLGYPLVPVAVNLSPTQFKQENLVTQMMSRLAACNVPTEMLTIEITESIFVSDIDYTREVFQQFQALGLTLSIDDFGTGYSSLSYLASLPLNNLKIDISFIVNLATDSKAYSIVKVIINMAHELGMRTIAEGVETVEQMAILKQLGCDLVQGFYYSHSLPGDEIGALLQIGQGRLSQEQ